MNDQARKALQLARDALALREPGPIRNRAIAAIDAALSAPAAPAMQWRKVGSGPWWDGCPDESDGCGPYETRIIGTAPAAPVAQWADWISVEDRLPEPDSGDVLVWLSGGRYAFDEWRTHREDPIGMSAVHTLDMGTMWRYYAFEDITHWMPLPPAPGTSAPAAPVALTDERAAFEAWFKGVSKKVHLERCGDTYFGDWAACAWEGWQARCASPAAPVAQPLTDEQIDAGRSAPWGFDLNAFTAGVRFAERKHGIGQGGAA